jgi:3-isopropylmalate/(R)-2-methylmalate dehydratase large subunit
MPQRDVNLAIRLGYQRGLRNGIVLRVFRGLGFGRDLTMATSLYEKVFDRHVVRTLSGGAHQLFIGLHLVHEVTSPHAFQDLRDHGLSVRHPERTFATQDHANPTTSLARPYADSENETQVAALERNVQQFGIRYFSPERGEHGIVHVIGPELGLTQPGMTIACGDSHTPTHGAFGAIAFGIGTSQIRDVLATQTLTMEKLKVRRIDITGHLRPGVYAKDVALHLIRLMGAKAGVGFVHEFGGEVIDGFSMEERMTLCNMAIEGGARCGYVNPDATTYTYLQGRDYAPKGTAWDRAVADWDSIRSDADASYDDRIVVAGETIEPMVTWGVLVDQSAPVGGTIPDPDQTDGANRVALADALEFMGWRPGQKIAGMPIDVAFIGSCTNGRLSDFLAVADLLEGRALKVAPHVKAMIVPGSQRVRNELVARGLDKVFLEAGFEFREAGCSMCLALNPDRLQGRQVCASSSNRNFKGRQGSPTGRTLLMSPVMVAASAIAGAVIDPRGLLGTLH